MTIFEVNCVFSLFYCVQKSSEITEILGHHTDHPGSSSAGCQYSLCYLGHQSSVSTGWQRCRGTVATSLPQEIIPIHPGNENWPREHMNAWAAHLLLFLWTPAESIDNNPAQYLSVNPHLLVDDFFDAWIKKRSKTICFVLQFHRISGFFHRWEVLEIFLYANFLMSLCKQMRILCSTHTYNKW